MRPAELPIPGILWGAYPERRARPADPAPPFAPRWRDLRPGRHQGFLARVRAAEADFRRDGLPETQRLQQLRAKLARHGLVDETIAECFALIGAACARELGLRPREQQIVAARIMLDNRLAEMATGEGKTLACALAAAAAALAGVPVHVITANDYLAARDADALRPIYTALGLNVGAVTQDLAPDRRRDAYACEVAYCTAKGLVFDYLRDGLIRSREGGELGRRLARLDPAPGEGSRTVLRGLCMALIDEADSILIDEARVPLILSRPRDNAAARRHHAEAMRIAAALAPGDFQFDADSRRCELSGAGREVLERQGMALGAAWHNRKHREEVVCLALTALHRLRRDRDYLVRDGRVLPIDETTGRVAPGRAWSLGLHQLVEIKEACRPSAEAAPAARITYQRFFPRYLRLGGMSGTLREARTELRSVYGLGVTAVPLARPCLRTALRTRVFASAEGQWIAVVARVMEMNRRGRPVLVGTDSVAESEALARRLAAAGLACAVLSARHDRDEAAIVARAGERGRITVATNMAGRGTDIALGPGAAELGGLHIILCQQNASRRIDRQFAGRCARRGEPGSWETFLALESPRIDALVPKWLPRLPCRDGEIRYAWLARLLASLPQLLAEHRERRLRRRLAQQDERNHRQLSFGGPGE